MIKLLLRDFSNDRYGLAPHRGPGRDLPTHGPAREGPAPPSARGVHSLPPHASHPMRVPRAAKLSPKNLNFFVIEGCRRHIFKCRASRGYAPRPIKQGESGVLGGVCAACIFFRGPLVRTAAVWYTHGVFDHGRGFGWDVRVWVNSGRQYDGPPKWKRTKQVNHQVEREAGWPDGRTVKGRKPQK